MSFSAFDVFDDGRWDVKHSGWDAKHSCCNVTSVPWPSTYSMFRALDSLKPTAMGPDGLPEWLLRLAAPFIAEPVAYLVAKSHVPIQWKETCTIPLAKKLQPIECADFRPISITSDLS